jgi:hypothetical protein
MYLAAHAATVILQIFLPDQFIFYKTKTTSTFFIEQEFTDTFWLK